MVKRVDTALIRLWGDTVGAVSWLEDRVVEIGLVGGQEDHRVLLRQRAQPLQLGNAPARILQFSDQLIAAFCCFCH